MWCAKDEGFVYDITDDSGDLHSIAKQHIPPYVNEIIDPFLEEQCVYSAFDCQGALHYLLGHMHPIDGNLRLSADGTKREIFTDYGILYETIRQRKGYSLQKV
jgi:hypothetical protein